MIFCFLDYNIRKYANALVYHCNHHKQWPDITGNTRVPTFSRCTTSGSISDGTKIYTSREERTRFRVRIADAQMGPGTTMIGTDEIVVSLAFAPNLVVGVKDGVAVAERGGDSARPMLKLSDVRTGFSSGRRRRVVDDENDLDIAVKELIEAKDGNGERWELV